jgi:hypothetical protein
MAALVYIDEPADSPRRMACRKCKAKPGQKCTNWQGHEVNLYCKPRWHDLELLLGTQKRIADWNEKLAKTQEHSDGTL